MAKDTKAAQPSRPAPSPSRPPRSACARIGKAAIIAGIAVCALALALGQLPVAGDIARRGERGAEPAQQQQPEASAEQRYRERYRRYWKTDSEWEAVQKERRRFLRKYSPNGEYGYGGQIEGIVADNFKRLNGDVYLDNTGAVLYQEGQLANIFRDLTTTTYGNSHSKNPSASASDQAIEDARRMILQHFGTSASEYTVIFTSGATGALRLVAESFPWTNASNFVYLRQNHNSVLGIREVAIDHGARFQAIPEEEMNEDVCNRIIGGNPCKGPATTKRTVMLTPFPEKTYNLFAFPAEDNFAGVKYPLEWVRLFKERQRGEQGTGNWLTLVDAAAYVPTHKLNLTEHPIDFVAMSFYKMFGYPTGLGALVVRNEVTEIMQKTFFGGGTVVASSCDTHFCLLHSKPCTRFEDGTVSFLGIAELRHGFAELHRLGMGNITKHVWSLTSYAYDQLSALRHKNGKPVLNIHGKHHLRDSASQGGIVNFNVMDEKGDYVGYHIVQKDATDARIHLRTGCSCNPGACYGYLGIASYEVERFSLKNRDGCGFDPDMAEGRPLGSVRTSYGYTTTFEDIRAFIEFIKRTYVH
eukprot:m51a1_g6643 putative molybdenum cofactor sulfurase (584) ;mRNA; f:112609-114495